jgi:hypothetical protein
MNQVNSSNTVIRHSRMGFAAKPLIWCGRGRLLPNCAAILVRIAAAPASRRGARAATGNAAAQAGDNVAEASVYGQIFFGFLPIENVFGSADTNS